ncbi:MAG: V-type ATP synthase subunit D [Candidatus Omnitrophica bacterium]|nr:V-type ATP synthase subunit D [Candidatus Omnitrophota bacterium]MBU4478175.1 V-type ATP synthase subunit D [Candidatus Omnitrophota bacterium]MCG2703829.1 V-type ATP synthase subunit D [Candidatus Omnitrophota bacterium]
MAQIQYNKTFLIQINKDLAVRQNALPVLQSKEAALRAEARRIRMQVKEMEEKIESLIESLAPFARLWSEFPELVFLEKVIFKEKKIAGVKVAGIEDVLFRVESFSLFAHPAWFLQGVQIIKQVLRLKIELNTMGKILESVEYARRKTTQKVNLYEKVQIPYFEEAIRRIKRFLEDEENLSKSSQKVIKKRMEEPAVTV